MIKQPLKPKQHDSHLQKDLIISAENQSLSKFLEKLNAISSEYVGELNHYYDSIIACMPNNVYWLDRNCILLGGNDNLAKMFGLKSRSELVGLTYEQMARLANWKDGQEEKLRQDDIRVMKSGKPEFNIDEPPHFVDGKPQYYISTKVPLFNKQGEVIGVVGISIDITERKLAEEREKIALANAVKQQAIAETEAELRQAVMILTGSIAHDIRTPLMCLGMDGLFLAKKTPILLEAYKLAINANLPLPEKIDDQHMNYLAQIDKKLERSVKDMEEFVNATLQTLKVGLKKDVGKDDLQHCSMWHCLHNTLFRSTFLRNRIKY